ncbi:MAG TPA: diacylglycerol kinase family protein [Flavobacterium sp.]|nr:diacylglycerol kinase family protein [Flavobacterium sp.]
MKDNRFVKGRMKSMVYSIKGAYLLVTSEHSIMVQFFIGVAVTIAGFYFEISPTEWMFQILAIGLVLAIEGANTAIEKIADFIHPDYHEKIGFIKDVASGAVFYAALAALAVGIIIYYPKVMLLF